MRQVIDDLEQQAGELVSGDHYDADKVTEMVAGSRARLEAVREKCEARMKRLFASRNKHFDKILVIVECRSSKHLRKKNYLILRGDFIQNINSPPFPFSSSPPSSSSFYLRPPLPLYHSFIK